MKTTDLVQLLEMTTDQRNDAECDRNALMVEVTMKISEIISLKKQVEELTQENSDLRDSLQIAIYG
jgi:hypothetical protein